MVSSKSILWATFASAASAYDATSRTFAVNHFYGNGPMNMGRVDPIISPNQVAGHVHAIQGGNGFAMSMADNATLGSTCTSSRINNDKSNYWVPTLFYQDPTNGSLTSVPMSYMNVYYFFEPTTDKITQFPVGLRMVVGDPFARNPPRSGGRSILDYSDGTPQPIQWTCPRPSYNPPSYPVDSDGMHGSGIVDPNNAGAGVGFPMADCNALYSPLRADIHFPSCYNPAAGLDNYKENMDWPTNGNCPEGWIHTPHMFYEVYWQTNLFKDMWTQNQGTQPFVLSCGDPTGYGLHADFISGWEGDTLQNFIDTCNAGDLGMENCPTIIGGKAADDAESCILAPLVNEVISGTMAALPGDNSIDPWGVNATAPSASSSIASSPGSTTSTTSSLASVTISASSSSQASSVAVVHTTVAQAAGSVATSSSSSSNVVPSTISDYSYAGCYADNESSRALSGVEFANVGIGSVTNTKCVSYCSAQGYSVAGTEYAGQCFCGNALPSAVLDASTCSMPCEGNATETCGGSLALTVYSKAGSSSRRMARHLHRHLHRGNSD